MHMYVCSASDCHSADLTLCSTGEPDRPPSKVGVAVTDIATGLYTHGAIMAALISRQQTGKGCWIDANLFESQVQWLSFLMARCLYANNAS